MALVGHTWPEVPQPFAWPTVARPLGRYWPGQQAAAKLQSWSLSFHSRHSFNGHLCDAASLNSYGLFVLERLLPADRSCERADRKDQCSNLLSLFIFISMALVYLRFFCAGVFILLRCLLVGKRRQPIHEFTRGCSKCEQLKATESKSVAAR